jgi:predicted dinucleotide-binding enzyme
MTNGRMAPSRVGVLGSGEVGRRLAAGFSSRGHIVMIGSRDPGKPELREWLSGEPTMLIAGDDADAKSTVGDVLADFGWLDPVDIGGIEGSRELEAICIVWVKIGGVRGSWDHGFKLLVG